MEIHVGSCREWARSHGVTLGAIALGGGIGAVARYGLSVLLPVGPGEIPWATFTVNVAGCFGIGVVMVLIAEMFGAHRLAGAFLGVGFLGGFTTFSAYLSEIHELLRRSVVVAFSYLGGTLVAAMFAVIAGVWFTRAGCAVLAKHRRQT